jgi:DoxX-like family
MKQIMSLNERGGRVIKRGQIIYWVETLTFSFFLLSGGVTMLFGARGNVTGIEALGYPGYLCRILGTAKILGVAAILWGRFSLMKEWAYAGFTFLLLGASASHLIHGDESWHIPHILLPLALLSLALLSRKQLNRAWK